MPQRLSDIAPTADFTLMWGANQRLGAKHPHMMRPESARLAMTAIAECSLLQVMLGRMFVRLLKIDAITATEFYTELFDKQNIPTHTRALNTLANTHRGPKDQERLIVDAILALVERAAINRNVLAHWIWGYTDAVEHGILLCEPKVMMRLHVAARAQGYVLLQRAVHDHLLVVLDTDLIDLTERIRQYAGFVDVFLRDEKECLKLGTEPAIRLWIDHQTLPPTFASALVPPPQQNQKRKATTPPRGRRGR